MDEQQKQIIAELEESGAAECFDDESICVRAGAIKVVIAMLKASVSQGVFDQVKWERDTAIAQLEEIGKGLGAKMDDVYNAIGDVPSVDAVPLDKLCEWLSDSSINIPCTSCANFVNDYCTAIGDMSKPCPNSADDWRQAITKWMEEQDAAEKDS